MILEKNMYKLPIFHVIAVLKSSLATFLP